MTHYACATSLALVSSRAAVDNETPAALPAKGTTIERLDEDTCTCCQHELRGAELTITVPAVAVARTVDAVHLEISLRGRRWCEEYAVGEARAGGVVGGGLLMNGLGFFG